MKKKKSRVELLDNELTEALMEVQKDPKFMKEIKKFIKATT